MKKKAQDKSPQNKKFPRVYLAVFRKLTKTPVVVKKLLPVFLRAPDFNLVTIVNNDINSNRSCRLSRGFLKLAPDWVCWVNLDNHQHVLKFTNGRWPFAANLNTNHGKITVPALSASRWYQLNPSTGTFGQRVSFEYGVDAAPPPPGPDILSDD